MERTPACRRWQSEHSAAVIAPRLFLPGIDSVPQGRYRAVPNGLSTTTAPCTYCLRRHAGVSRHCRPLHFLSMLHSRNDTEQAQRMYRSASHSARIVRGHWPQKKRKPSGFRLPQCHYTTLISLCRPVFFPTPQHAAGVSACRRAGGVISCPVLLLCYPIIFARFRHTACAVISCTLRTLHALPACAARKRPSLTCSARTIPSTIMMRNDLFRTLHALPACAARKKPPPKGWLVF
jgi:hypothetical protein